MHNVRFGDDSGSGPPLAALLRDVLSECPRRRAVKALAQRCHQGAQAYLRKRTRSGTVRREVLGEDVGDLALDAIANLFERDEEGRFPELRQYFWSHFHGEGPIREEKLHDMICAAEEASLESALRRLVWSAAGDWLFEAYRVADRSLSNQIRSLKRAVKECPEATLGERDGAPWVVGETEDAGDGGRQMPIETMEACLAGAVAEARSTADLLQRALRALRAYRAYETAYPVTRLAQAMRGARAQVQSAAGFATEHASSTTTPGAPPMRCREVEAMIERALEALQEQKRASYVEAGKVSEEMYRAYFRALGDRLRAEYVSRTDGRDDEEGRSPDTGRSGDEGRENERAWEGRAAPVSGNDIAENGSVEQGKEGHGPKETHPPREGARQWDVPPHDLTHYEALAHYLTDLSKATYREKHRARFEYLYQEAERELKKHLREVVPGAEQKEE